MNSVAGEEWLYDNSFLLREKNTFSVPCVQVLWGSGCKSTLPNQWDYFGGEGRVEAGLCFSFWLSFPYEHGNAHSALPALGLPSVPAAEESSQTAAHELSSLALSLSPKSGDSLLALGPVRSVPAIHPDSDFLSMVAPDHRSLHTLSNFFLPRKQLFYGS